MAGGLKPIASAPIGALLESSSRGVPEDIFGADLVHWYRDGWTGTEAVDLIDSANNMTAAAGREPSAGAVNGHVTASFPGVDEVIACSDVSTVAGATEITIFGAFNLSPGQASYACIIGKLYGGVEFHVGANATGDRLVASVGVNFGVSPAESNADPFDGTWHRFVYTWNNVSGGVLYLDGVAQTITEPAGQGSVPDATEFLSMGGVTTDNSSAFDYFATGETANIGIAIREANGTEITDLDDYLADWVNAAALSDLAGSAAGVATTSASIVGTGRLTSVAAAGVATTTAILRGTGTLTSVAAAGVATTTASIIGVVNGTSVAANGVATTSASIVGTGRLTSVAANGVATTTASIVGTGTLTGVAANGVATTTAVLRGTGTLTSVAAAGVATTTASIVAVTNMSGSAAGVATTTASIVALFTLVLVRHESRVHSGARLGAVVHAGAANDSAVSMLAARGALVHAGASDEAVIHAGAQQAAPVAGAA